MSPADGASEVPDTARRKWDRTPRRNAKDQATLTDAVRSCETPPVPKRRVISMFDTRLRVIATRLGKELLQRIEDRRAKAANPEQLAAKTHAITSATG